MKLLLLLKGKKTYFVSFVMIIYAIVVIGYQANEWEAAVKMVLEAFALSGLRNAIK